MALNSKQTSEMMRKAGWSAQQFMDSLNSTINIEADRRKLDIAPIDIQLAEQFLARGSGIDGDQFDILERWVERRSGFNNDKGQVFAPPQPGLTLSNVNAPLLLPADTELAQDGPEIEFKEITNQKARAKMLVDAVK